MNVLLLSLLLSLADPATPIKPPPDVREPLLRTAADVPPDLSIQITACQFADRGNRRDRPWRERGPVRRWIFRS